MISRYHYYDIEATDLPIIINSLQSNKTDSNGTCGKRSSVHLGTDLSIILVWVNDGTPYVYVRVRVRAYTW